MPEKDSWRTLYPFASHTVTLQGLRYHYVDEGSGQVLLMVHGNPTWSFYWRNLIGGLSDRYRTIAPDHIGCGLSDKPADYAYTLDQHIRNLVSFVEQLDLSGITLLAHDWGGPIGLGAALALPDRFSRLVLFNTGAFPPSFIPLRIRVCRVPILGRLAVQGLNLFARAAPRMAVSRRERMTPAVKAGLLAPYDCWAHRVAIHRFVQDIPLSPRHETHGVLAAMENDLPNLADRPVQLIWGMRDWCFRPECLDRLAEMLPGAEVHRLQDAGHYVVEDAHERIVPLVERFLERHPVRDIEQRVK